MNNNYYSFFYLLLTVVKKTRDLATNMNSHFLEYLKMYMYYLCNYGNFLKYIGIYGEVINNSDK